MEFIVVISSDEKDGLRGRGIIDAQGRFEVSFSNNDRRLRYGTLNEDGNMKWGRRGRRGCGSSDTNAGHVPLRKETLL